VAVADVCKNWALAIRTADCMNKSVAFPTADFAAITSWCLFSCFVTPVLTCAVCNENKFKKIRWGRGLRVRCNGQVGM